MPSSGERSCRMKKIAALLCVFLLLCAAASAEEVSFGDVSFSRDAAVLDLGDQVIRDFPAFMDFLREFPDLRRVDMFATQVTAARVSQLEEAFPEVKFGWTLQLMRYKDRHIVRTDAEAFSTLHGICPNHPSSEFELLKYCTEMLALDLGHNNLTDISFLRSMPRLRVLILGENKHLKNIELIGELQDLEYLELFTCGIRDITPLTKLPRLMDLNLANNSVKDWRPLKEMKQLKRLWISDMGEHALSAAEKAELEEALPDTEIMYKGQPTDNGWRTLPGTKTSHPHYEVVYEIFHTGVYIPFEESAPLPGESPADWIVEEGGMEEETLNGIETP